jgi:hypothetical protein
VTMNRTDESTPIRLRPDWIACSTTMPSIAEYADPRPPNSDVPPMTAAAMAVRLVSVVPLACDTDVCCPAASRPPTDANTEHSTKTLR